LKKYFSKVVIIICITCLFLSTMYIMRNFFKDKKQNQIFAELRDVTKKDEDVDKYSEDNTKNETSRRNLEELYNKNNDFIGWLEIENTHISYPIMQTGVDRKDYYLRKNFYKKYSQLGTPYISEYCNIKSSDNIIVYGHHINNYQMFGELEKYKNKDFYENHQKIKFDTLDESMVYEIFAVFKTTADEKGFYYYKFINSNSEREFFTFIQKCKELSFYETNKKVEYRSKLITLSTCEYSSKNGRLVIVAKKITEEEEKQNDKD